MISQNRYTYLKHTCIFWGMSRVAFVHSNIAVKQFESEMFVIKTAQKNISFTQKSSIYDIVFKH